MSRKRLLRSCQKDCSCPIRCKFFKVDSAKRKNDIFYNALDLIKEEMEALEKYEVSNSIAAIWTVKLLLQDTQR